MSRKQSSNRRDFLTGKAAGQAAADALEHAAERVGQLADRLSPTDTSVTAAEGGGYVVTLKRRAMACDFEIRLNAHRADDDQQTAAAVEALDLIDELESQLTVYRETSEIIDINRRAASEAVDVEPRLFELLQTAEKLHYETAGAFDLTAGPLSQVWGFDRRAGRMPDDAEIEAARAHVGWEKVALDGEHRQIRFSEPGVQINVNSIGKGYALDRACEALNDRSVTNFMVHGGRSTLLASGMRTGQQGWTARLRHPLRPQQSIAEFCLVDEALSTSGSATQSFVHRGKRYGHLIDPRTGWPAAGVHSATVIASTAALADALSTAFYIMDGDQVEDYCANHPDIKALLVLAGGEAAVEVRQFNFPESDTSRVS